VKDLVLTGYLNMNRDDIVLISALQLVIEYGHQAIGTAQYVRLFIFSFISLLSSLRFCTFVSSVSSVHLNGCLLMLIVLTLRNIVQLCVPAYFQQDPEIELDIIEKYDELLHMAKSNAQLAYLNLVQSHDFFGAHTFKLLVCWLPRVAGCCCACF
jgi:hypothetical protein